MRVVAPMSVNGGRSIASVRAAGPLTHHDVEAEVLERRVQDLLGGAAQAVDLVDEEDVSRLERGQDRRDVLALEVRAGDLADADAELVAHDLGERRLAEPGRPREQNVVQRIAARAGASSAIASCSLTRSWPTNSPRLLGRRDRSSSSSASAWTGARNCAGAVTPPSAARAAPARPREASHRPRRAPVRRRRATTRARRARRAR